MGSFLRRHRVPLAVAPIGPLLGLAAALTVDRGLGLAVAAAVVFGVGLLVGYRESQHLEADRHRSFLAEIHEVEHVRATSERLRTWVPHVVRAEDPDVESDDGVIDRAG